MAMAIFFRALTEGILAGSLVESRVNVKSMASKILWSPSVDEKNSSQMAQFARSLENNSSLSESYQNLHKWSVNNYQEFWSTFLQNSEIIYKGDASPAFQASKSHSFIGGKWFPNIQLNFAQNILVGAKDLEKAIIAYKESEKKRFISGSDLERNVLRLAKRFKELGLQKGDRVAAFVPNTPEVIIAMLACTYLGAIWSSCSPDFGSQGVLDRFNQIDAKIFICSDSYTYNGKNYSLHEKNKFILENLKQKVEETITIPFDQNKISFDFYLGEDNKEKIDLAPEQLAFSDPLYIMYSSGTTGKPKCMVHSVGGTLLQHKKEHLLHGDLKAGEKILYYTTCGWMMWNWLVTALACKATVCCYEGSPAYPNTESIWQLVDQEEIEHFGTSAKYIGACRNQEIDLGVLNFKKLRKVYSTGSPLLNEDFDYFYANIKKENPIPLNSICGGTDIISCFMLGNPLKDIVRGEIQGAGLGMDVDCFDSKGQSIREQKGELVCKSPFPSMPTQFWLDDNNQKYQAAYFKQFKNIWAHGDYISITNKGGILVHGRSDTTLNPGGVRIGSAEIYSVVEQENDVLDSLVIGQQHQGDERIILFVKLSKETHLDEERKTELKKTIKAKLSPRHIPKMIFAVNDIPYTISGKKVEKAIKIIFAGEEVNNQDALKNPEALAEYSQIKTALDS